MLLLLVNLIDNALRATEAGGRITVKAYKESGRKILEVADNGREMCIRDRDCTEYIQI